MAGVGFDEAFSWRTSSGSNHLCFQPDKDQNKLVGPDQKLPKGAAIPIPEASKSTLDPLLISRGGREQQITLLVQEDYGSKVAASNFSLGARSRAGFVVLHPNTGRLQRVGGSGGVQWSWSCCSYLLLTKAFQGASREEY